MFALAEMIKVVSYDSTTLHTGRFRKVRIPACALAMLDTYQTNERWIPTPRYVHHPNWWDYIALARD